jgi:hypothetical protein
VRDLLLEEFRAVEAAEETLRRAKLAAQTATGAGGRPAEPDEDDAEFGRSLVNLHAAGYAALRGKRGI